MVKILNLFARDEEDRKDYYVFVLLIIFTPVFTVM